MPMKPVYLERHDPEKNLHRFYKMLLAPGIFGDWALIREWGRVGSPGTVRKTWFDDEAQALIAQQRLQREKMKKGYSLSG